MSNVTYSANSEKDWTAERNLNRKFLIKKTLISLLILSCMIALSAQEKRTVYFFGSVSSSTDTATIKLTEDLYYSQMLSLTSLSVKSRRETVWNAGISNEYATTDAILFHAEIQEKNAGWQCTLSALDMANGLVATKTYFYEGYYKILMDAKNTIISLFNQLEDGSASSLDIEQAESQGINEALADISLEQLAGNWQGDSNITKVVIQKSGRGFVIFKNGATMNITVSISGGSVTAMQSSGSNASFFPELPRDVALKIAKNASPVTWSFELTDWNTLTGTKQTLAMNQAGTEPEEQSLPTVWTRL